jgi:hypothetical protein
MHPTRLPVVFLIICHIILLSLYVIQERRSIYMSTPTPTGLVTDTRRSISGGIVIMAGGPINWLSKLQPIVAVSSMEAEYIACFFAIQDIVWIRQLLKDLGLERTLPTSVHIDNKSARQLAENPVHHQRSKHIDIKYHWFRDMVSSATVKLIDVHTDDQRADFLTKTIRGDAFWRHVRALMLVLYKVVAWFLAARIRPVQLTTLASCAPMKRFPCYATILLVSVVAIVWG